MKSINLGLDRYSHRVRAVSVAALLLTGLSSAAVFAGDVRGGAPDVNQILGRSSATFAPGGPVKTGWLTVEATGRNPKSGGAHGTSKGIASRSGDGLINEYGRGTPNLAVTYKGASSQTLSAR
ncbi:MAG TPA: hypothetical protein VNM24_15060 [Burkholderiales bacterium]|jgi:hypothetical protein|nr:hypothetical protein [Burkholderiales bacterium]